MKIVIITKKSLRHQIFLSKVCELFAPNIAGIFFQGKISKKAAIVAARRLVTTRRIWKGVIRAIKRYLLKQEISVDSELLKLFNDVNLDYWKYINAPIYNVGEDINSESTLALLRDIRPDLILVFGGKILKYDWISLPRFGTVNMHYGILPYYRSAYSAEFAMYQENIDRIGASIHYVNGGVDTGPIISKHFVNPKDCHSFAKLRAKVYEAGINALLATAMKVIGQNSRLITKYESCPDSFYPAAGYRQEISKIARLRISLMNKGDWPYIPNQLQKQKNNRIYKILPIQKSSTLLKNGVYMFLYHSIVSPKTCMDWERAYTKVWTSKEYFFSHIDWLSHHATPVRLSDVPNLLKYGSVDKPYFAITFDDGYTNIINNALSLFDSKNIHPTVFVNSSFVNQDDVYYRVLAALLNDNGYGGTLKNCLEEMMSIKLNSVSNAFSILKDMYQYQFTEKVVHKAWKLTFGKELPKRVHLDWNELRMLHSKGWEIGNHTVSHPTLTKLDYEQQKQQIEDNVTAIENSGIRCIKWLSYPNGMPKNVNKDTYKWM
ncbi:MAG: polysaccharide deacetylase family protein [Candidatus Omnitrophica bacterium]|nr:polysaccharide deacetylase family protein [Candidatus Omnitrophota bacterium]